MKIFDPATSAYLARRAGSRVRFLVHVWAENRATSAVESLGLWNGEQDRAFTIRGEVRTYFRAAGMMAMDEIVSQPGTDAVLTSLTLSPIDAIVRSLMGGYILRFTPIEIHRALFWPDSGELVAEPVRIFKGWIDRAPTSMPELGETPEVKVSLASAARALTRTLAFKKSDPALSESRSGDRFRRYTDVGSVVVPWGEARVGSNQSPAPNPLTGGGLTSGDFGRSSSDR